MKDDHFGDITLLNLDHPGANDPIYRARRNEIAEMAKQYMSEKKQIPQAHYTQEEHHIWRMVTTRLEPLHHQLASTRILEAKNALRISTQAIPEFSELNKRLAAYDFRIEPTVGLIDPQLFLENLENRSMFCTQYIRHGSKPEYTPEPDVIHEIIGHVPMFTDKDFAEFSQKIGKAARVATPAELKQIESLYWYTIEFGLIQEKEGLRVYGAGLLSSIGEIEHCFTTGVERRPFDLEEVIQTPYDFSKMQEKLFVIHSFDELLKKCGGFLDGIIEMKGV